MNAFAPFAALALLAACSSVPSSPPPTITSRDFGVTKAGRPATLWTLRGFGIEVDVTDLGATLVAVRAPDRAGFLADVVLGFPDVAGYESAANQRFGATLGRVADRIGKGEFQLDGRTYVLTREDGHDSVHGGSVRSFDKVHWRAEVIDQGHAGVAVRFGYDSKEGEEGFPGSVRAHVTYALVPATVPVLAVHHEAWTDRRTPVNLGNHTYWNLAGEGAITALDHTLQIAAAHYLPNDDTLLPTGEVAPVQGTPFDFTEAKEVGLHAGPLLTTAAKGYDHYFVLPPATGIRHVATLHHEGTGRTLAIDTTAPGLRLDTGNRLRGQIGKAGHAYGTRSGIRLSPHGYPDAVHHATFPSILVEPGVPYVAQTRYRFPGLGDTP